MPPVLVGTSPGVVAEPGFPKLAVVRAEEVGAEVHPIVGDPWALGLLRWSEAYLKIFGDSRLGLCQLTKGLWELNMIPRGGERRV